MVVRTEIDGRIIDAATIYAGAAAAFDYACRRRAQLPHTLSWDAVRGALKNMRFWDEDHPRLYAILEQCEAISTGPFAKITGNTSPAVTTTSGEPSLATHSHKKLCGSTSMSSLMPPLAFGAAASQSRR